MTLVMAGPDLAEIGRRLGVEFHGQQQDAVGAAPDRPVQIVAGAGAGKTTVMAARVVWLVGHGRVRPDQVLGLTFTNAAAAGLAGKIRGALRDLDLADGSVGEPAVSTYHAYAGRLVREHGLRVGAEPDARLLADATRFQLAGRVMRGYRAPLPHLDRSPGTVLGALVGLDAACADHLADPAAVRAADLALAGELEERAIRLGDGRGSRTWHRQLREAARTMRARADLCLLVLAYRRAKRELGLVDFGDQIATAVAIAQRCPEAVRAERERYPAVLLDEYQDTSVAQRQLLAALFGGGHPVTAVGDPCQAIYGWRGASVHNLTGFPRHFPAAGGEPAQVLPLSVSQRNGGRLLAVANQLSAGLRAGHAVPELTAPPARAEVGEVVVSRHERFDEELAWLAGVIRAELDGPEPTPPGQVAVLLRAWKHAGAVHAALTGAGIPVEVVGLGGLLSLPEVADLVATLEVLDDPTANASLVRLLTGPRWMLGPRDLRALGSFAARLAGSPAAGAGDPLAEVAAGTDPVEVVALADALDELAGTGEVRGASAAARSGLSAAGAARAAALGRELRALRRRAGDPLLDLVHHVTAVTGLEVEVAAAPEAVGARRRESLAAFVDVAAGYTGVDGDSSLHGFLEYLRAADDYDRGFDAAVPSAADAVQILTVHKAKGLEWDVVALPDLTAGSFPSTRDKGQWPTSFAVLPTRHRQDAASLPAGPDWARRTGMEEFRARVRDHQRLEEDRLGYVAVTRARRLVIASGHRWGPTQVAPRAPSPYLLTLAEHARAGFGRIDCWVADDAVQRNPYLSGEQLPWPVPLRAGPLAARRAAADAVRRAMGGPGGAPADGVLQPADAARFAGYDAEIDALLGEAREARADLVEVPLPPGLSASEVVRLARDPDGLAADLARPVPRRPRRATARGTAFHSWVEQRFAMVPLLEPDQLAGAADDGMADAELDQLRRAFLASPWAERRPHAVEAPFAVLLGGRVVRGRIDAVYRLDPAAEPDGCRWHVVDWKTGHEPADALQLAIYRTAWARLQGCPEGQVRASFLAVRSGTLQTPALPGGGELAELLR